MSQKAQAKAFDDVKPIQYGLVTISKDKMY
jgi:hypothetical protein